MHSHERFIDLGCSLDLINYHLARCTPQRMLQELGQIGNTHGLSTEEELMLTTQKDSNLFLNAKLFTTLKRQTRERERLKC
jgi:hypothetical protein